MLSVHRLDDLAEIGSDLHLALGVFDGVHAGHQVVIGRAVEAARRGGGIAGLVTFDPHPIRVLAPAKAPAALLATLDHKERIVRGLGIGLFVPLRFDAAFAALEAREFLDRLTAAPVRTIAVGEDWRFGHERRGDAVLLAAEASARGYRLEAVPPVMFEGERISSTRIRQAIRDGNLAAAAAMLGRPYSICGRVERGQQRGRTIGFPTANLDTAAVQLPPDGVWAVIVETDAHTLHKGVANLGLRPTVDGGTRVLETHLLDFEGDLYDRLIDVRFVRQLRPERKFPSLEALRDQIRLDAAAARVVLGANDP